MVMDHISRWMRLARQELRKKRDDKSSRLAGSSLEDYLVKVDSILSSIDEDLVARAAFECKAYARSLMSFESQIRTLRSRKTSEAALQSYYDRLHRIYAHLDEADGMEGVSRHVIEPSLEHNIRQHESLGHWTSAQSCWEVRLQNSSDDLDCHIGLLRCLRNLGHYG